MHTFQVITTRKIPFVLCLNLPTSFFPLIYQSVHLYIHSAVIFLSTHPFPTHLLTHPSAIHHSFIHSFIHPSTHPPILLSICLSVSPSVHTPIHPSFIHPYQCIFPPTHCPSFLLIQKQATTSTYHAWRQLGDIRSKAPLLSQLNPRGGTQPSTEHQGKRSPEPRHKDQSSEGGNTTSCWGLLAL